MALKHSCDPITGADIAELAARANERLGRAFQTFGSVNQPGLPGPILFGASGHAATLAYIRGKIEERRSIEYVVPFPNIPPQYGGRTTLLPGFVDATLEQPGIVSGPWTFTSRTLSLGWRQVGVSNQPLAISDLEFIYPEQPLFTVSCEMIVNWITQPLGVFGQLFHPPLIIYRGEGSLIPINVSGTIQLAIPSGLPLPESPHIVSIRPAEAGESQGANLGGGGFGPGIGINYIATISAVITGTTFDFPAPQAFLRILRLTFSQVVSVATGSGEIFPGLVSYGNIRTTGKIGAFSVTANTPVFMGRAAPGPNLPAGADIVETTAWSGFGGMSGFNYPEFSQTATHTGVGVWRCITKPVQGVNLDPIDSSGQSIIAHNSRESRDINESDRISRPLVYQIPRLPWQPAYQTPRNIVGQFGGVTLRSGSQFHSVIASRYGVPDTSGTVFDPEADQVSGIKITAGGFGYSTATVAFSGGGGSGAVATVIIFGSVIREIHVANGGSGYTSSPTIEITGDGSGATADALRGMPEIIVKCGSIQAGQFVQFDTIVIPSGQMTSAPKELEWILWDSVTLAYRADIYPIDIQAVIVAPDPVIGNGVDFPITRHHFNDTMEWLSGVP